MQIQRFKGVIVGDSAVGKTCLLLTQMYKCFPTDYVPRVFSTFLESRIIDGKRVDYTIWDTLAPHKDYDHLRPSSYPDTQVVIICFSLICASSFENVQTMWIPELNIYCPQAPRILVGTKLDLRDDDETISLLKDKQFAPISYSQGLEMMRDIGADSYIECSALTHKGVTEVFEETVRIAIATKFNAINGRKGRCTLI
ncbi:hypothetical protein LOD99_7561 [Oopsacas minuta]|uniref:Uncharacterized protein n=1 Tax=Oopsacas minuta TaxID=111878 RepID=A0AAV7JQD1_9METZ|nr:hypothetical protein LOD99_7561 [Oopsacas minuta]